MEFDERLVSVLPSARQRRLQALEFYAFIHFTVNAFTDREWGDGTESPSLFAPSGLDAGQWARAVKDAGMRGMILTAKHHDGFCLWPSACTRHSVAASPFMDGKGDVVKLAADACREYGLAFGVYLSPWDRNCPLYGQGKAYDDYFVAQLTELLTGYGPLFCVWFDGACGEGPNGKKQVYDWARYYETVRRLQLEACISICGPDVRWCGNEAGSTREAEWSVVPARLLGPAEPAAPPPEERRRREARPLTLQDADLGSRETLAGEPALVWYPAEVDTSIRPGWFWHASENGRVRPLTDLIRVYFGSVGGNATLLLNVPPTDEGLLHENDVQRLRELGGFLRRLYADDAAKRGRLSLAPGEETQTPPPSAQTPLCFDSLPAQITLRLPNAEAIGAVSVSEDLSRGQRIESYTLEVWRGGAFRPVYSGITVGAKKLIPLFGEKTQALRLRITAARGLPVLSAFSAFTATEEDAMLLKQAFERNGR